ncbi:hypothetical protein [Thermacetogenium phaeum]|nr:hypothetical protein [Thermacetogenium phaeum]
MTVGIRAAKRRLLSFWKERLGKVRAEKERGSDALYKEFCRCIK